ncbi:MAG: GAF domain-containing protein [Marinilabilia sp.]
MSKMNFVDRNFQKWLLLIGGTAFVLSLLKNIFLGQHPGAIYYVVEFLAFLFFLTAFFICDKNHERAQKQILELQHSMEKEKSRHNARENELQEIIKGYEEKQNEATRFASYQDKVIGKLLSDEAVYHDRHHLLYLLSELFHGMAVILFKKDEPSGRFVVETTYGLPDDFEPQSFEAGEGIHGQVVNDGKPELIEDIPEEYFSVNTALGESRNYYLYMLPVIKDNVCTGLIELLTFRESDVERIWPGIMNKLVEKDIL